MHKDIHTILDWMLSTHTKPPHHITEAMERIKNPTPEVPKAAEEEKQDWKDPSA